MKILSPHILVNYCKILIYNPSAIFPESTLEQCFKNLVTERELLKLYNLPGTAITHKTKDKSQGWKSKV